MDASWKSLVDLTRSLMISAQERSQTTLGEIIKGLPIKRNAGEMTLVNTVFNMDPSTGLRFPGIKSTVQSVSKQKNNYELFIDVKQTSSSLSFEVSYRTQIFKKETIQELFSGYLGAIQECLRNPNGLVSQLEVQPFVQAEKTEDSLEVEIAEVASFPIVALNEVQERIVSLWKEALGVTELNSDDDFSLLGGHSLLAAQLITKINEATGLKLRVNDILRHSNIKVFLESIGGEESISPVLHESPNVKGGLSKVQEDIWMSEKIYSDSHILLSSSAWHLKGSLDVDRFRQSFKSFCESQSLMNATFFESKGSPALGDGKHSLELDFVILAILKTPVQAAMGLIELEGQSPFNLNQGPLFRAKLYRISPHHHIFFFGAHHIIWDGWSFDLLLDQLKSHYLGSAEDSNVPSYQDFVSYEKNQDRTKDLDYWKQIPKSTFDFGDS